METGELLKLTITAFEELKDAEKGSKSGKSFEAFYNPESFSEELGITYAEDIFIGHTKMTGAFKNYTPTGYGFDLLFDGTGASLPNKYASLKVVPTTFVAERIKELKETVYGYEGNIHRVKYLQLSWGETAKGVTCVLSTMTISYTLFHPDGNPLRAKVTLKFKEAATREQTDAEKNKKSPDLTHIRTVRAGDRLPLMCEQIYGDPNLYLQVAKFNNLRNHRNLNPGQKIYFPPLVDGKA
jgi:hypothetical protein